jgi:beta-phosphoglucomutase
MIKALIFDMDGTIVDNIPYHHAAWLNFLKKYGINLRPEDFAAQNHGTADEMIIRFFGSNLSAQKIKELGYEKEQSYRDLYRHKIKEVTGFTEFIKSAKSKGIKTALATMGNEDNINFILESLHLKDYFDLIVGGNQVRAGKPNPEIYHIILEALQVAPKDCLAFEDSLGGVQSASQAGIAVVGICTSHSAEEFHAWNVFKTVKDFSTGYSSLVFECLPCFIFLSLIFIKH